MLKMVKNTPCTQKKKIFEAGERKADINNFSKEYQKKVEEFEKVGGDFHIPLHASLYQKVNKIFVYDRDSLEEVIESIMLATLLNFPQVETSNFVVKPGDRNFCNFIKNADLLEIEEYKGELLFLAMEKGIEPPETR